MRTDGFLFPENSDRPGIPRDAQPALRLRIVRSGKKESFTRRQAMELDRMGSSIIYPGKDISSAVIRVISALISGKKTASSFSTRIYTDNKQD